MKNKNLIIESYKMLYFRYASHVRFDLTHVLIIRIVPEHNFELC
jgi:hypothetical protein